MSFSTQRARRQLPFGRPAAKSYARCMSRPKRHHWISRGVQFRRFSEDPSASDAYIWRLTKATGMRSRVNPRNEAVIGHFYSIELKDGTLDPAAEHALAYAESEAAKIIEILHEPGGQLSIEQRWLFSVFIGLTMFRTPAMREHLNRIASEAHREFFRAKLVYPGWWEEAMQATGAEGTAEELEANRRRLVREIDEDNARIVHPPNYEILQMLKLAMELSDLVGSFSWTLLRADGKASFVLGDTPVTTFDPEPFTGAEGLASSPRAETTLPLGPELALLMTPEGHGHESIAECEADFALVREQNLRTYARAQEAVYGNSEESLKAVARAVKTQWRRFQEVQPRPMQMLFIRDYPGAGGVLHRVRQGGRRERLM